MRTKSEDTGDATTPDNFAFGRLCRWCMTDFRTRLRLIVHLGKRTTCVEGLRFHGMSSQSGADGRARCRRSQNWCFYEEAGTINLEVSDRSRVAAACVRRSTRQAILHARHGLSLKYGYAESATFWRKCDIGKNSEKQHQMKNTTKRVCITKVEKKKNNEKGNTNEQKKKNVNT